MIIWRVHFLILSIKSCMQVIGSFVIIRTGVSIRTLSFRRTILLWSYGCRLLITLVGNTPDASNGIPCQERIPPVTCSDGCSPVGSLVTFFLFFWKREKEERIADSDSESPSAIPSVPLIPKSVFVSFALFLIIAVTFAWARTS